MNARTVGAGALRCAFLVLVGQLACGSATSSSNCQAGATQLCLGPGACSGAQICSQDGTTWGQCDCGSSDAGLEAGTDGAADSEAPPDVRVPPAPDPTGPMQLVLSGWIHVLSGGADEYVDVSGVYDLRAPCGAHQFGAVGCRDMPAASCNYDVDMAFHLVWREDSSPQTGTYDETGAWGVIFGNVPLVTGDAGSVANFQAGQTKFGTNPAVYHLGDLSLDVTVVDIEASGRLELTGRITSFARSPHPVADEADVKIWVAGTCE